MVTPNGAIPEIRLSLERLASLEQLIAPQLLTIRQLEGQLALVRQGLLTTINAFAAGAGCPTARLELDLATGKVSQHAPASDLSEVVNG